MALLTIWNALVTGVAATIVLDLVAGAGVALHVIRVPAFGQQGVCALRGRFAHGDIDRAPPTNGENALTFPVHYVAGIILAAPYLVLLDVLSLGRGASSTPGRYSMFESGSTGGAPLPPVGDHAHGGSPPGALSH